MLENDVANDQKPNIGHFLSNSNANNRHYLSIINQ